MLETCLFIVALDDAKHRGYDSAKFKLLPSEVEKHLVRGFDEMLRLLLDNAAIDTHEALDTKNSTVDPTLLNLSFDESEEHRKQHMTDRLEAFASFSAEAWVTCKNYLSLRQYSETSYYR